MDWSAWKTALELWLKTPELIVASILVGLAVYGIAWKHRGHSAREREGTLRDSIASLERSGRDLEGRLRECREDLSDAKGELREGIHQAKDDQQRITWEVEELRRENGRLRSTIKELEEELIRATVDAEPRRPSVMKWVQVTRSVADRTDIIDRHLTALSTANTTLEGTLSDITKKLEIIEPSDNGKRSKK
jgi:DNA repair exonuclease SbcCD ATPase subunit